MTDALDLCFLQRRMLLSPDSAARLSGAPGSILEHPILFEADHRVRDADSLVGQTERRHGCGFLKKTHFSEGPLLPKN
jgi:hypothetical protein